MTPQQRERNYWKANGAAIIEGVEQFNPYTKRRKDLFGFADLLVIMPKLPRPVLVQVTSGANHADRLAKVKQLATPELRALFYIHVSSWRKNSKNRWVRRSDILPITTHELAE